ncbi:MAG: stage II sporulation protein R [Clostridiales bacterium]|nr:stage II sporulation protein R [Clostridiales bacterium]
MSNQPSVRCLPGRRSRPALLWGALLLSGLLLTASWAGYRQTALAAGLVRFHVVAASDSEADQRQKLLVRDAVLAAARPLLAEADSAGDSRAILSAHLEELAQAGGDALRAAGGSGTVTAALNRRYYSTRYGEGGLPPRRGVRQPANHHRPGGGAQLVVRPLPRPLRRGGRRRRHGGGGRGAGHPGGRGL